MLYSSAPVVASLYALNPIAASSAKNPGGFILRLYVRIAKANVSTRKIQIRKYFFAKLRYMSVDSLITLLYYGFHEEVKSYRCYAGIPCRKNTRENIQRYSKRKG